jgi:hypothetical protein
VHADWQSVLQNQRNIEALVLNMPSPAWTPDDQDDTPVAFAEITLLLIVVEMFSKSQGLTDKQMEVSMHPPREIITA